MPEVAVWTPTREELARASEEAFASLSTATSVVSALARFATVLLKDEDEPTLTAEEYGRLAFFVANADTYLDELREYVEAARDALVATPLVEGGES